MVPLSRPLKNRPGSRPHSEILRRGATDKDDKIHPFGAGPATVSQTRGRPGRESWASGALVQHWKKRPRAQASGQSGDRRCPSKRRYNAGVPNAPPIGTSPGEHRTTKSITFWNGRDPTFNSRRIFPLFWLMEECRTIRPLFCPLTKKETASRAFLRETVTAEQVSSLRERAL